MATQKYLIILLFLFALAASDDESYDDDFEDDDDIEDIDCEEVPTAPACVCVLDPTSIACECFLDPGSDACSSEDDEDPTTEKPTEEPITSTFTPTDATQVSSMTPTLLIELRIIRFEENFDSIIGDRSNLFLSQCNDFWGNLTNPIDVLCRHVQSGSILLSLEGTAGNLDAAEAILEDTGMDLPDFDLLQTQTGQQPESDGEILLRDNIASSSVTGELWFIMVMFGCGAICAVGCAYMSRIKCWDNEEGFVPADHDKLPKISIEHPHLKSSDAIIEERGHLGIAVRDGSNAFDVYQNDRLGPTPMDAPNNSLSKGIKKEVLMEISLKNIKGTSQEDLSQNEHEEESKSDVRPLFHDTETSDKILDGDFSEEGKPTGFPIEDHVRPQTRPGEPSICDANDPAIWNSIQDKRYKRTIESKPTSGIIPVKKPTSGIIPAGKPTSGIILKSSGDFIPAQGGYVARSSFEAVPVSVSL